MLELFAKEVQTLILFHIRVHPVFEYKLELGEDELNSSPRSTILREVLTLRIPVVQNKSFRTYYDEEIETLQNNLLLISVTGLESFESEGTKIIPPLPIEIKGISHSGLVGMGTAVLHELRGGQFEIYA